MSNFEFSSHTLHEISFIIISVLFFVKKIFKFLNFKNSKFKLDNVQKEVKNNIHGQTGKNSFFKGKSY